MVTKFPVAAGAGRISLPRIVQHKQGFCLRVSNNQASSLVSSVGRVSTWLRLLGARGGKAFGRNQRLRRALLPTPPPATVSLPAVLLRATAEDIAVLDARFPWLRGAERRVTHRPAHAASDDRRAA